MRFSVRTLLVSVACIAVFCGAYYHGYRNGGRRALADLGVYVTEDEYQIVDDDTFFFAIEREPHYSFIEGNEGKHIRGVRWSSYDTAGSEFYNQLEYTPHPDAFLGPECELPIVKWTTGLSNVRPDWDAIKEYKIAHNGEG